ncbi:MAG: S8 family serine peptidase [Lentisphaerae bacterium]|nr:S8 family serine peptidase [Lentisphaerota bacterium]
MVQDLTDPAVRQAWSDATRTVEQREAAAAESMAAKAGIPPNGDMNGHAYQFVAVRDGRVYMRATRNQNAAISTAVSPVRQPPYSLTGTGLTVAVWDAGSVRSTHQEFVGRLSLRNSVSANSHSTHVGGTIAAAGVTLSAMGMAPAIHLDSYDWNFDTSEMIAAAMAADGQTSKIQLSNHSYGFQAGWFGTTWYGTWGNRESDSFGMYDTFAREQDQICFNAPYYLPFKAAGNDRNDGSPGEGQTFTYFDAQGSHTKTYDPAEDPLSDNWELGGYDTIALEANAKNIVTVGAVNDAVSLGARSLVDATMTTFSSWGPADDGRVKPDLVANGASLYSTVAFGDAAYGTSSGTSMASPNAMGSAALLIEAYGRRFPGRHLRASTLKGLLIHTADDLGRAGPDYQFGWGLINTLAAVRQIESHAAQTNAQRIVEAALADAATTNHHRILWDRTSPIRATLCWTDPAGPARIDLDDRTPVLVHDLDLRIVAPDGATALPYVLDATNPAALATLGDNHLDNVEQVAFTAAPVPGEYDVCVSMKGVLTTPGGQSYSLLISGSTVPPSINHTPLLNTTNSATPYVVTAQITSEVPLNPASLWLFWNASGSTNVFASNQLVRVTNDWYAAVIPAQAQGGQVSYYLQAAATNGVSSRDPAGAPAQVHHFEVVKSLTLFIGGQPVRVPGVVPDYGFSTYPSGVTVHVSAPYYGPPSGGSRDVCLGWVGCCSIPASGTSNALDFAIGEDVYLAWQWGKAYSLTESGSVPGVVEPATTWWVSGTTGLTAEAAAVVNVDGVDYRFTEWQINGARMPDATQRAANPAAPLMAAPSTAVARYVAVTTDADGDGVSDWWEQHYFGGTNAALNLDADGDGFSSLKEFQDQTDPLDAASMPTPPSIAHVPIASPRRQPAPWGLTAMVTDNDRVASVSLEWRRNYGAWLSVTAMPVETTSVYTSAIPAPGVTGDQFQYRVVARDAAGLLSVNGPYSLAVAYPVAMVTPTNFGTLPVPMTATDRRLLTIENDGHEDLSWSLRLLPAGLRDDAERGTSGWTHGGTQDVWHLASWRTHSGSNAWYFGNDGNRQYPDSAKAWLLSPPVFLHGDAQFSFWHWISTEALKDAQHAWDGAIVELSTNNGATFTQIAPVGGYPYAIYGHSASAFTNETPCLAGTGGWQRVQFDLSGYAGQTARLRLFFGADGFVVNEGWYVDDLEITPYGGAADWIYPAYSNGLVVAQDTVSVPLFASAASIPLGETRQATAYLESNDPFAPLLAVPVGISNITRKILVQITGAGTVVPAGPVFLNAGSSTNFWLTAAPYHHVADIRTNGLSVGGSFGGVSVNFAWTNVAFANTGRLDAVFAENVTTSGVPEMWLAAYGLTNAQPESEAQADRDADQMAAWEEYIAGTDPTNPSSRFEISAIRSLGTNRQELAMSTQTVLLVSGHVLEWPSVSDRTYRVFYATNLAAGFVSLSPDLPATPPVNRLTNALPAGRGFYRLDVSWPR